MEAPQMLRSCGLFQVTTLLQALSLSHWLLSSCIFFLVTPLLYLVQLDHLLGFLPDDEESLIPTGIRRVVNQHRLSQHASLFLFNVHSMEIFCIPHWTIVFLRCRLSASMW